ncbi:hypothetical protein FGG08_005483 [Glutinoglossum americanum]|uniref:O-acyltransferase n=1 Tax=Glutinoglossum americanum TaxID=1670608 RepID=A0A9P8I3I7_9PEZI|nr:hypothetical protein FGG08_005483 [Glutinoglossum americanum]
MGWPFINDWTWTAQVFFTLHTLALLMKMHSYAFYNGHLSETQRRLRALDNPSTASRESAYRYPTTSSSSDDDTRGKEEGEKVDVGTLREDLAMELISPLGRATYPQNLTVWNFCDYLLCPTLCYELEYPRTQRIQWTEVIAKTLAVFGCIFLLTITSEEFILPVMIDSAARLEHVESLSETVLILAESFADRHFYSDWWNSTDWLEFSREWNIPVHHFFRRHVYGASRPHLSRPMATIITFLISAIAHELVMACITKKVRGFGLIAQMMQLPIVLVQRTKWVKGKKVFNNVCFWISMILGLSTMCSLYVLF